MTDKDEPIAIKCVLKVRDKEEEDWFCGRGEWEGQMRCSDEVILQAANDDPKLFYIEALPDEENKLSEAEVLLEECYDFLSNATNLKTDRLKLVDKLKQRKE